MTATCEHCGHAYEPKRTDSRFCCSRCKSAWHREHEPAGQVRSVRKLTKGRVSVVTWFDETDAPRALRFEPGQRVIMGKADG